MSDYFFFSAWPYTHPPSMCSSLQKKRINVLHRFFFFFSCLDTHPPPPPWAEKKSIAFWWRATNIFKKNYITPTTFDVPSRGVIQSGVSKDVAHNVVPKSAAQNDIPKTMPPEIGFKNGSPKGGPHISIWIFLYEYYKLIL